MNNRPGFTLMDQLLTMGLIAVLCTISLQHIGALRDRLAVRSAKGAITDAIALAREHANAAGLRTAVRFNSISGVVLTHAGADTLARAPVYDLLGVSLAATRDSMAYQPSGLGYGAANMSIVLSRGAHHDTITISRLGRVK